MKDLLMPKELTHLMIAEASRRTFSEKNPNATLSDLLKRCPDHYRFGSVMHDVAFFSSSTALGNKIKQQGLSVHGVPPGDTVAPFRYLAALYDRARSPEILALTAGAATHMITDCLFHPMVYHFSGHRIDRHYRLETLIDTHLFNRQTRWLKNPVSVVHLYAPLKEGRKDLARTMCGFLGLPESFTPEVIRAMTLHAITLKLFRSRAGYWLFRLFLSLGSDEVKSKIHLFYPPGMRFKTPFFDRTFAYRHPVTGDLHEGHLERLVDTAIQKSCDLFEGIETAASHGRLESFFSGIAPLSLETGLDLSSGRDFRYTDLSRSIDRIVSAEGTFRQ